MGLRTTTDLLNKITTGLTNLLLIIAASVLASMMFLTATDVGLRYVFNSPLPGGLEIVEYMMGVLVPFALVYTAHKKGHIGVELVIERFPGHVRKVIGCVTTLMTFLLFTLITWQSYYYIVEHYQSKQTSAVLYIPVWPFIILFAVASAVLTLVLLVDFIRILSEVSSKWTRS
jgi:TRAP-type C4-dicarboxylate transport system permease small subunit